MGVAVLGSRRSGTTLLHSLSMDIILKGGVAEKVRYILEPYYWQTEIEHPAAKNLVPHMRSLECWKKHLATPYHIDKPGYKDDYLEHLLSVRDDLFPVVKFTLALGRSLPIVEHSGTKVIYIIRRPVEVLASIHELNFDLGEVATHHGAEWPGGPGKVSDWELFYPDIAGNDRLARNAERWGIENLWAFAVLAGRPNALILTFDELEKDTSNTVIRIADFLEAELSNANVKYISKIPPRPGYRPQPQHVKTHASTVAGFYETVEKWCQRRR